MKTANKLICLLFSVFIISCNNKTNSISEVDYDADKSFYKLEILDNFSDSIYKTDNHNKCTFLVTKSIYIKGKFYQEGTQHMDVMIDYCKKNKVEINNPYDVKKRTTISIKTNNKYKEVFIWEDPIFLNFALNNQEEDSFAERDSKIKLETGWVKEKEEIRICLKIIFDELDNTGGFKQNILNFARTGNTWKLLKRERINTMIKDPNKEKMGYCYDTIFYNCENIYKDSKSIYITNTMMFDLQDPKCY